MTSHRNRARYLILYVHHHVVYVHIYIYISSLVASISLQLLGLVRKENERNKEKGRRATELNAFSSGTQFPSDLFGISTLPSVSIFDHARLDCKWRTGLSRVFLVPRRAKSTNGMCSRSWRRPSATTAARCFTGSPIRDSSVQVEFEKLTISRES